MMMHHGSESYEVAASKAANEQRAKFESWIDAGKDRAVSFFENLEDNHPQDYLVETRNISFDVDGGRIKMSTNQNEWFLHKHALNQMIFKTGVLTQGVSDKMICRGDWGQELLLHNLHTIFDHNQSARTLVRVVQTKKDIEVGSPGEVRGFLSDRFNRLDSRPIFTKFAEEANTLGCVPVVTNNRYSPIYNHDIKVGFAMFLPHVFEPVANEVMIIGLEIANSDFGGAAVTVRKVMIRLVCTNMMVRQDELRKVHLGAKLPDNIELSADTYRLNTEAMSSTVKDVVKGLLNPKVVNDEMSLIRRAASEEIDAQKLFSDLRKGGNFNKKEEKEIVGLYNSADISLMPAGQSVWRASNAISLFANRCDDESKKERATELRQVAGQVLDNF